MIRQAACHRRLLTGINGLVAVRIDASSGRHTTYIGDFSSDVCSSDLVLGAGDLKLLEVGEVETVLVGPRGAGDGVAGRAQRLDIAPWHLFVEDRKSVV